MSVFDGWWAEAYDGLNGSRSEWARRTRTDVQDERDGKDLDRVLREEIIPLYFHRDRDGFRGPGSSE